MNDPTILPTDHHARMVEAAQAFLDLMEAMAIEHHGVADFSVLAPDARQRLIAHLAVQSIMQPGSWRLDLVDLDNLGFAIGAAIGAMSSDGGEEKSAGLVRAMIQGYTGGRNEGIAARMQFMTTGRAN